jgi:hypothetical protein
MKSPFLAVLIEHLLMLTIVFGTIYVVAQQNYRMSANDPQVQMVEDTVGLLQNGTPVRAVFASSTPVHDIASTLTPFVVIYDQNGKPLTWTGTLDGTAPSIPEGVLNFAKGNGENRLTWQPRPDVRIAAVVEPFSGPTPGFVLAGRSLKEVEKRENQLLLFIAFGWIASLLVDATCIWVRRRSNIL